MPVAQYEKRAKRGRGVSDHGDIPGGEASFKTDLGRGELRRHRRKRKQHKQEGWHSRPVSRCAPRGWEKASYQLPVFGMLAQGSLAGSGVPFCNSSMEIPSGERTKAMLPSRGGRLIVTPLSMRLLQ